MSSRGRYREYVIVADGVDEAVRRRRYETLDIVERLLYIPPSSVRILDYPAAKPVSVFNPAIFIDGDTAYVYARIIFGYYLYVSSIGELRIPLNELLSRNNMVLDRVVDAKLRILPDTMYDINGAEDPRISLVDGKLVLTYCGRSVNYYSRKPGGLQFTAPISAIAEERDEEYRWVKREVYYLSGDLRGYVAEDRDAFIIREGNQLFLFHRPTMIDGEKLLLISRIEEVEEDRGGIVEVKAYSPVEVLRPSPFESKIGWATPPIRIGKGRYIAFIHGVDREIEAYRMTAVQVKLSSSEIVVEAVTPQYIMEPKTIQEIIGDRPYTVFPCGLWRLDKENYLVSIGAADYSIGIGLLKPNALLEILENNRFF